MSCKACGGNHRGWKPCLKPATMMAAPNLGAMPEPTEVLAVCCEPMSNVVDQLSNSFDKKSYMKSYMREYRAKQKAANAAR